MTLVTSVFLPETIVWKKDVWSVELLSGRRPHRFSLAWECDMPRKAKHSHALADDGAGGLTLISVDGDSGSIQDVPGLPDGEDWTASATAAFTLLMARTDGWLRASPDKDGKLNHFKWKFNSTRWPNHYVYYCCPVGRWAEGMCGLYMKVRQVDEGVRKPTYDTYYNAPQQ